MKPFRFILLNSLALFFLSLISNAQSNQVLLEGGGASIVTIAKDNENTKGSPYLNKNFVAAKVSLAKQELYYVRYNVFNDQFEVKADEIRTFNKNTNDLIITIVNDNTRYGAIDYIDKKNGDSRGYFIFLTEAQDAKVKLYAKKNISYLEAKPAVTGYDKDKPAEFKHTSDTYFVSIDGQPAELLPKKKKDIIKLFSSHSGDISNFIKSNKIKVSRKDDLIKLVDYINTL